MYSATLDRTAANDHIMEGMVQMVEDVAPPLPAEGLYFAWDTLERMKERRDG